MKKGLHATKFVRFGFANRFCCMEAFFWFLMSIKKLAIVRCDIRKFLFSKFPEKMKQNPFTKIVTLDLEKSEQFAL